MLHEDIFRNIATWLPGDSDVFFNNSKVIPARLIFNTSSGAKIEIFCLQPLNPPEYQSSFQSHGSCSWECLIGNAKRFKEPKLYLNVLAGKGKATLFAERISSSGNTAEIRFEWDNRDLSFAEVIEAAGQIPLPPYIKREPGSGDRERYQTIYSSIEGSVAAPTAGLHFTDDVLQSFDRKNIKRHEITLHVGAGTFQPVKAEFVKDHKMHAEYFEVTAGMAEKLATLNKRVTCVGTTTVRTLESLYWIGVKLARNQNLAELRLAQWEPYSMNTCTTEDAFKALIRWFEINKTEKATASTSLMIVPGYRFIMTENLITNFHQPGSSLLMLIAAFAGDSWKETYQYALENGFRFLSYGDSSLLMGKAT